MNLNGVWRALIERGMPADAAARAVIVLYTSAKRADA